ncbi:MAG: transcription repressor NadR [Lachnospiraceae bacterium]
MDGDKRRKEILKLLKISEEPISGTVLAKNMEVSRQVIVQDIALLRATNKNILSTNKGYVIYGQQSGTATYKRIIAVKHSDEQMKDELYTIVDHGAKLLDVVVEHEVYGQIAADLFISSRRDVDEFIEKISNHIAKPLKYLTGDVHYHTIEASDETILDKTELILREKGYLILP